MSEFQKKNRSLPNLASSKTTPPPLPSSSSVLRRQTPARESLFQSCWPHLSRKNLLGPACSSGLQKTQARPWHHSSCRFVLSESTIAFLYKSHVRSTMEYCCPIWMGNTASELSRLDTVQRSAMRLMGPWGKDLRTLSHRRGVAALCALHRIVHGTAPPAILHLCPERIPACSRP